MAGIKPKGKVKIEWSSNFAYAIGLIVSDGCTYSYWDKRWKLSFMFYTGFASGSKVFLDWLHKQIKNKIGCKGYISTHRKNGAKNNFINYALPKMTQLN